VGIDLSVSHAERCHLATNIRFVGGYALDLLESGEIEAQIAFASSTFSVMPPRELARYIAALIESGARDLLIVDPMGQIYHPEKYPGRSIHLASGMWGHDYRHYLKDRASSIEVTYIDYRLNPRRPLLRLQKIVATISD